MNINDMLTAGINLSDVKTGFDPLPKGVYATRVAQCEDAKESQKGGSWYIPMRLEITEDGDYQNRQIFFNLSLPIGAEVKPTALSFFKSTLLALGYTEEELANFIFNKEDFIGRKCYAAVDLENRTNNVTGEQELQNKVKSLKPMNADDVLASING